VGAEESQAEESQGAVALRGWDWVAVAVPVGVSVALWGWGWVVGAAEAVWVALGVVAVGERRIAGSKRWIRKDGLPSSPVSALQRFPKARGKSQTTWTSVRYRILQGWTAASADAE